MKRINLTRQQLYDLVWSHSLLTLSKSYNISDRGLRKICKRMNIPLPPIGYWQKRKTRKKVKKTLLKPDNTVQESIALSLLSQKDVDAKQNEKLSNKASRLSFRLLTKEIENDLGPKLIVPEHLTNPDKLISEVKHTLLTQRPDEMLYIGFVHSYRDQLAINVGRESVDRALRFMDTLIKAMRSRHHDVKIIEGETVVIVEGTKFKMSIREKMKRGFIKDRYLPDKENIVYYPTQILRFISDYAGSTDGKQPLEGQLAEIIAGWEIGSRKVKERYIQRQRQEAEELARERKKRKFAKIRENEFHQFIKMLSKADRWRNANNLRNYIQAKEKMALANNNMSEKLKAWLDWAKRKADWYDPLVESEDSLLIGINRNTF